MVKRFSFWQGWRSRHSSRTILSMPSTSPLSAPNTGHQHPFFGHVTGVSGHRYGQIGARSMVTLARSQMTRPEVETVTSAANKIGQSIFDELTALLLCCFPLMAG